MRAKPFLFVTAAESSAKTRSLAAVHSKAVVCLLFIHCLLWLPLFVIFLCLDLLL